MKKNPMLLQKRLNAREEQGEPKEAVLLSGLMFMVAFIAAGASYRFGWLMLPMRASCVSAIAFLLAYALYAEVLRENEYLSRTIEVREDQKVVDTGLYGIVRHPMYSATIFLFLAMPLILNCIYSFVIMLAYFPIINARMKNEEEVLKKELKGYDEYMKKVKYRIVPFIW